MRWLRRSTISAFCTGFFWASVTTAGLIAMHYMIAPPAPDSPAENLAKLAFQAKTEALDVEEVPISSATSEVELRKAQTRVAQRQADMDAQQVLTRSIQQELRRVGCYGGPVDGYWSDSTRNAMGTFTQGLNVKLPLNAPDYILLTMLQGQRTPSCSKSAETIAARKMEPMKPPRTNGAGSGLAANAPTGTATIATSRPANSAHRGAVRSHLPSESRTSATIPSEPAVVQVQPLPAAGPTGMLPVSAPIPGRMAIGAPVDQPAITSPKDAGTTIFAPEVNIPPASFVRSAAREPETDALRDSWPVTREPMRDARVAPRAIRNESSSAARTSRSLALEATAPRVKNMFLNLSRSAP